LHGADYSNGDCSGTPLLYAAVVFNRLEIVRALVHIEIGGVDVNALRDFTNSSALDVSIYLGRVEIIDLLLGLGAPSSQHSVTPLHLAAMTGNADAVRIVLDHSPDDVNALSTSSGRTPLHCVADKRRVEGMKEVALLYEERVLDGTLEEQQFRLVWNPPRRWRTEMVDLRAVVDAIVAAGADITVQDSSWQDPIRLAASTKNTEVVWSLLDHGADPLILYVSDRKGPSEVTVSRQRLSELAEVIGLPGKEGMFEWLMEERNETAIELEQLSGDDREKLSKLRDEQWMGEDVDETDSQGEDRSEL